jgi:hypothetical protein
MAMITKTEYGMVAVNNSVLSKQIVDNILDLKDAILPCNKKGRIIKKGFFTGLNELLASVELSEAANRMYIKLYLVLIEGTDGNAACGELFDRIENDFETLCLDKPKEITAVVKGTLSGVLTPSDLEITRQND